MNTATEARKLADQLKQRYGAIAWRESHGIKESSNGASSATGDSSASLATGSYSSSEIKPADDGAPQHATAIATGLGGRVRAPEGCALVLVERSDIGALLNAWAGIAGRDGIKPDTWYTLQGGLPVEVAQ
jgi:hypothetical protein